MGESWLRYLVGAVLLLIAASLLVLELLTERIAVELPASAHSDLGDQPAPWPAVVPTLHHVPSR